jgi:Tol biopolymer transport system component
LPLTLTRIVAQENDNFGNVSRDGRLLSVVDEPQTSLGFRDIATGQTRWLVRAVEGEQFGSATLIGPGSDRVIYVSGLPKRPRELRAIALESGGPATVYASPQNQDIEPLAWSTDGAAIVAQTWAGEIRSLILIRLSDKQATVLKAPDRLLGGDSDDHLLAWLPDGQLAVASGRKGIRGIWLHSTISAKAVGTPRLFCEQSGRLTALGMAHDGRLFVSIYHQRSDIYLVDLDPITGKASGGPTPVPNGFPGVPRGQASWSRDGKQIAYVQHLDGLPETIVVQEIATGTLRVYPVPLTQLERPDWFSGAQTLAIKGVSADGAVGVFHLDVHNGDLKRIADRGNYFGLSPDGQTLFYTRPDGNVQTIWRKDLKSGAEVPVDRGPRPATKLSPDGESLALYVLNGGKASIAVVPSSGGERRVVTDKLPRTINTIGWSHDSRHIYVVSQPTAGPGSYEIWRVPAAGGEPEQIGIRTGWMKHLSVRPDGRQIALSVVAGETEVWSFRELPQAPTSSTRPGRRH